MPDWESRSDPNTPRETPRLHPTAENYDVEVDRPIGTRSFTYGAKTLAASLVALVLSAANHGDTMPAFWTLLSAGLLGIMFSFIERRTTLGAETVNQRRVNVDVLLTALLAVAINLIVYVAQR
jgi:uncharacterized membrane protein